MKDLNYAKGIERLYNVVWACLALYGLAVFANPPGIEAFFMFALPFSVGPYIVKKIAIWIIQGFKDK